MSGSWCRTSGALFAANGAFGRMRSGPGPLAYDRAGSRKVAFRSGCEMACRGLQDRSRDERTGGMRRDATLIQAAGQRLFVLPLVDGS